MVGTIALSFALACPCNLHVDFIAMFHSLEFRYTGGDYVDQPFQYRLFVPDAARAGTACPMIVWLHGHGEAGHDNLLQLTWLEHLVLRPPWKRERYPFFLLAVQCPLDNANWTRGTARGEDMIHVATAILDEVMRRHPIDRDRIYLSGVSSGGTGCWQLAARQPELFAAVAPLATGGFQLSAPQLGALKGVPVWAFHCNRDGGAPVDLVRRMVADVQAAAGSAALTEIDSDAHDAWSAAFNDYCLLDWLLSQQRHGSSWSMPPGQIPLLARARRILRTWQWWQLALQSAIIAVPAGCLILLIRKWKDQKPP